MHRKRRQRQTQSALPLPRQPASMSPAVSWSCCYRRQMSSIGSFLRRRPPPRKGSAQSPRHPKAPAHNAPAHSGCQPNPPPLHSGSRAHRPTHGGPPPCRPAYPPCRHPHPPARLGYGQRTSSGRAGPSAIWFCWGAGAGRPALPLPPLMLPRSGPPPALRWLRPVLVALRVVRPGLVPASRFRWFCHLFVGIFWGQCW